MIRNKLIMTVALTLSVISIMGLTPQDTELFRIFSNIGVVHSAFASTVVTINNIKYDVYDSYAVVSAGTSVNYPGHNGVTGDVIIESEVNGVPVTGIGEYAFACYNKGITSVTIPSSVLTIGKYAFYYCEGLRSVTLNEGLKVIGNSAFSTTKALNKLSIPSTVETIEYADTFSNSNIKYMEVANGAGIAGINYQRNVTFDVLKLDSMPTFTIGNKDTKATILIASKEDTKSPLYITHSKLYYTENIKVEENCLIDTQSGDLIYFVRPDNEIVSYLDVSNNTGSILANAFRLGTDLKIIKAQKTWVDTQTTKPRVYFYDADGVECLAAYSVEPGTSLAEEAKR